MNIKLNVYLLSITGCAWPIGLVGLLGALQQLRVVVFGVVVLAKGNVECDKALVHGPFDGDDQLLVLLLADACFGVAQNLCANKQTEKCKIF